MRALCLSLFVLCFAAPALAQTAAQTEAAQAAVRIGAQWYEHDRAAWLATDEMLEDIRDPNAEGVRGWVTESTDEGVVVLFVRRDGEALTAIYRGVYRNGRLRQHGRVNTPLTEAQTRLYRARTLVVESADVEMCGQNYNSVVLPRPVRGEDGVDVDVYLLPAMTNLRSMPFGGYYRIGVNLETGALSQAERYTNSCIELPIDGDALFITQLVGDTPTPVHAFASLTTRKDIYVSASSGIWIVDGADVSFAEPPAQQR